jgi:hypothetical protein
LKAITKSVDALAQEIRAHLHAESSPPATYPIDAIAKAFAPLIQQLTLASTQLHQQLEPPPAQRFSSPHKVDHLSDDLTARISHTPQPTTGAPLCQPQALFSNFASGPSQHQTLSLTHPSRSRCRFD